MKTKLEFLLPDDIVRDVFTKSVLRLAVDSIDLSRFPLLIELDTTESMSGPDTSLVVKIHARDRNTRQLGVTVGTYWTGMHGTDVNRWSHRALHEWILARIAESVAHELAECYRAYDVRVCDPHREDQP